jgi:DNA-binding response OmpR family regulator
MSAGSILVVDDNPLIVNILQGLFNSEDYQVAVSRNGKEALETLESTAVDVVICDVMMPEMDGYQLLEQFRSNNRNSHVPFVFLTALGQEDEKVRGHVAGADDYLVKPFDPRELLAIVKGKVERSRRLKAQTDEQHEIYRKKVIQTLSHEFRTPLVAISTGAELLLDAADDLPQQKVRGLIEAIQRGGMRLERLVTDFMQIQQIEAGVAEKLAESRRSRVDPSSEILEPFEAALEEIRPSNFHYSFWQDDNAKHIRVYPAHVLDALRRISENAIKFAAEKVRRMELRMYLLGQHVHLEILDWGLGIQIQAVPEMTEVFGQVGRDKNEQQGGGLGLPIAAGFARVNAGRLYIESRPQELPRTVLDCDASIEFPVSATVVGLQFPLADK